MFSFFLFVFCLCSHFFFLSLQYTTTTTCFYYLFSNNFQQNFVFDHFISSNYLCMYVYVNVCSNIIYFPFKFDFVCHHDDNNQCEKNNISNLLLLLTFLINHSILGLIFVVQFVLLMCLCVCMCVLYTKTGRQMSRNYIALQLQKSKLQISIFHMTFNLIESYFR